MVVEEPDAAAVEALGDDGKAPAPAVAVQSVGAEFVEDGFDALEEGEGEDAADVAAFEEEDALGAGGEMGVWSSKPGTWTK